MNLNRLLSLGAAGLLFCSACLNGFASERAGATPFPKHPFVLVNESELAILRSDLAKPGWKADLYRTDRGFAVMSSGRGVRANADLWLKRPIEIPARGGHFHRFFCVDGDRLELPKDQHFVPGPYRCPKCGKQYSGEQYEGGLRRVVHGWLAQAALDLALVAALEHKPEYAAKAAEILSAYAAAYPGPHKDALTGGMIYQSLDEAMWVIPLAQAYDLIHNELSPKQQARIQTFLRAVAQGLQRCGIRGNWGSWHLSAVGVIGYAIEDEELINWATDKFKQQIRDQLGDDGLWPESVHTYHYFPLIAFMAFAEAAWHAGTDLYHWEGKPGKSLLLMFSAPLRYAYPDLRLAAINDGWFESFVPADCYELAFHRTQDPRYGWVLANGYRPGALPAGVVSADPRDSLRQGLYAFLFGGDIPTSVTPPPATSVNFPVLGICMLRSTNGAMMSFDYGPFLGHGQRDKMGITLFANRKLWLADYGTPGYGASILPWYKSTFAHNTIVVDGKSQNPTKENSVKLWLGGADLEAAASETAEAYPGVAHTRTVVRIGDCFVVADQLKSKAEHTFDLYLHSEGKLSLEGSKSSGQHAAAPVQWIEKLSARMPVAAVSGRWAEGGSGIGFWVGGSSPMTPITGQCPAETGSRKVELLISRQKGRAAEFVTVLYPYHGKLKLAVERRGNELYIRHGDLLEVLTLPARTRPELVRQKLGKHLGPGA
jgi:oligo-alginate lyase